MFESKTISSLLWILFASIALLDQPIFVHAEETDTNARLAELVSSLHRDIDGKGKLSAMYLCEAQSNCGGLIFYEHDDEEDEDDTNIPNTIQDNKVEYSKHFIVPLRYGDKDEDPNVFISSKPWLIQRGAVSIPAHAISSTILHKDYDVTIEDARIWCQSNHQCVGFSFPLQSEKSLTKVDEVIYVNCIAQFDYGPEHLMQSLAEGQNDDDIFVPEVEWITHIIHDRKRLMGKIPQHVDFKISQWAEGSTTPYRPCCSTKATLPAFDELKEADTLERIDCSISREDFFERYEKPRKPVILVGCTKDWRAKDLWSSFDTIKSRFNNDTIWEFQSITKDEFSGELIPSEFKTGVGISWGEFQEFHSKVKEDPNYGSIRMFRKLEEGNFITEELRKDYDAPHLFKGISLYEKLPKFKEHWFPKDFGLMGYFIMGSYGTGTGPHSDPLTTDAWSTLLTGHKWWLIYPKIPGVIDQTETQCSDTCSESESAFHGTATEGTMAWYASVAKHANKFYYGNGQHTQHVLQSPGETIYLPHGMLHSVLNMDDTIAITEKFASEANLEEVWREILHKGEEYDWPHLYYNVFNDTQREIVRKVLWPITKEKIEHVTDNTFLYTRKFDDDYNDNEEEEEEDEFVQLSLEEYDALTISGKHIYLDKLGYYLDFDPGLVKPSDYESMTAEEKEEYDNEMRWMASPEFFEDYLQSQDFHEEEHSDDEKV